MLSSSAPHRYTNVAVSISIPTSHWSTIPHTTQGTLSWFPTRQYICFNCLIAKDLALASEFQQKVLKYN